MTLGLFDLGFLGGLGAAPSGFDFLDPANIGQPVEGGFFAGLISHTADGNPTHALIVAPSATGATGAGYTLDANLQWADGLVAVPANATLINASSEFDGKANTDLMMSLIANNTYSAGAFPAAQFCKDLSIGGFTDWYLPARWELDIAYFNLKPSTTNNSTAWGTNEYSVPKRAANYTLTNPAQTNASAFVASSGAEAFVSDIHWTSTEINASFAWLLSMSAGTQLNNIGKANTSARRTRAFRRIAL
jgi:hypothetical protein